MQMLKRIRIAGWKSIKNQTADLMPLTVVIGANGAGKSNLLNLFKLLHAMFAKTPGFRNYVAKSGYADSLLHYGSKQTPVAEMELTFGTDTGETTYFARWAAATGGMLIFTEERVTFHRAGFPHRRSLISGAGTFRDKPTGVSGRWKQNVQVAFDLLRSCRLFHFHDTSDHASSRKPCYVKRIGSCIRCGESGGDVLSVSRTVPDRIPPHHCHGSPDGP